MFSGKKLFTMCSLYYKSADCRSGLCSKPPDLGSEGDIALNPSLRKNKRA